MPDFKEIRFPPKVSLGAEGGVNWLTLRVTLESGHEVRSQILEQPLGRWTVSHLGMLPPEYEEMDAFWHAVRGGAFGFRFKDWTDYRVPSTQSALIPIDATHSQLAKRYTFDAETFDRAIYKVVLGTDTFNGGSGLALDNTTGILTHGAGGEPDSFSLEFDNPVVFATDEKDAVLTNRNVAKGYLVSWAGIPIKGVRI